MLQFKKDLSFRANAQASAVLGFGYDRVFAVERAVTDAQREEVFSLRYSVYCEEFGFLRTDEHSRAMERDSFDEHALHVLLRHRDSERCVGTVRAILPLDGEPLASFPMHEICPGGPWSDPAAIPALCEISRLCILREFRGRRAHHDSHAIRPSLRRGITARFNPFAAMGLYRAAFEWVLDTGRLDCVALLDTRLLRSLRAQGFSCRDVGDTVELNGTRQPVHFDIHTVFAHGERAGAPLYHLLSDGGRLHDKAVGVKFELGTQPSAPLVPA
ncbi:MAG: PEP-CTERM/exosortase system-associated acyltransferase [Acidimicrobiia bacterium]